jgi:hypothetical protein
MRTLINIHANVFSVFFKGGVEYENLVGLSLVEPISIGVL